MMEKQQYKDYVEKKAPKTKHVKNLVLAFVVGGLICIIGQIISDLTLLINKSLTEDQVGSITTVIMIFIGSLLTGIGVYDKIGFHAGAGSIVPITGFANSIVSPAMEFNDEGIIFGIMSHMFAIAGPIIVSGTVASVAVGLIYLIFGL